MNLNINTFIIPFTKIELEYPLKLFQTEAFFEYFYSVKILITLKEKLKIFLVYVINFLKQNSHINILYLLYGSITVI